MKQQEVKTEMNKKLNDLDEKIQELKRISNQDLASDEKLQEILQQLESIKGNILLQYQTLGELKSGDDKKFPDLEKNIYKSFDSFESAYSKAGSLIKQSKFSSRNRSVDFKDPLGNE